MTVIENAKNLQQRVNEVCKQSGRNPDDINVIAVTKYVSLDTAKEAINAGINHLGENRDEGFLAKWEEIGDRCEWHFIGTLQSRKVKDIIGKVDFIHSLDRISLAKEINKRAEKPVKCFVQVNSSNEESKHGLDIAEVIPFIKELNQFESIEVVGLMTMAAFIEDDQILRSTFKKVKELQLKVQALSLNHAPCKELSMGMSNDFEIAIEEGATFIRIGTSLVGKEF